MHRDQEYSPISFETAAAAAARVRDGDLVRFPMGPVPISFVAALAARREDLHGVRISQGATRHAHPWLGELDGLDSGQGWDHSFTFLSDFLTVLTRPMIANRRGDFIVCDYALWDKVTEAGRSDGFSPDVFAALVSPPDDEGMVSFGYSLWNSKALLQRAQLSIAEIGDDVMDSGPINRVPLDDFDVVIRQTEKPNDVVLPQLSDARIEVTEVVGAYVSTLVNDRDTIQIGTGTLSSSMGSYLDGKSDLGVDAEILVASVVELIKSGVVTGRFKKQKPEIATASFIVPGADFAFCDGNPAIELHPIEWCNNLPRIALIENLVAINQASMIDLTGQVASESIGPVMYTGPGGQLSWTTGALYAKGGRSIHVLPSTARDGSISRIVSAFPPGTIVTVPRPLVDYVVTEHGIANLQGLTQRQRATEMIQLSHPKFRDELTAEARRLFWP